MDEDTKMLLLHIIEKLSGIEDELMSVRNSARRSLGDPFVFKLDHNPFAGLPEHLQPK